MTLGTSSSAPSLTVGKSTRFSQRAATPPTIRSAEAQLRSARVQIDREKLQRVVDLPFFISMRFKELENGLITLEFTGDGRFAYCERDSKETTIYEGVLVKNYSAARLTQTQVATDGGQDEEESEQQDTSAPAAEDVTVACIEGKGMVRYEQVEVEGRNPCLLNVECADFRFAITVRPCYQSVNMEAWVQPMFSRQRQQRKHFARVDANGNFIGEAFREKNQPEILARNTSRLGFSSGLFLERSLTLKSSLSRTGTRTIPAGLRLPAIRQDG